MRYLPLAALYDGKDKQWIIEKYNVGVITAAAQAELKEPSELKKSAGKSQWRSVGFGVSETAVVPEATFDSLRHVKKEIAAVQNILNGNSTDNAWYDKHFTEKRLIDSLKGHYPVVHIASHFYFDPNAELRSFLLLGDKTPLTLSRLQEDDFDFSNVEQVTLSACETAMTGSSSGSEFEGLGALVQRKGAKSVLASLWSVNDAATAQLLPDFYRFVKVDRLSRAQALQQAQIKMLNGHGRKFGESDYSHPFYWAPFILMGDWR